MPNLGYFAATTGNGLCPSTVGFVLSLSGMTTLHPVPLTWKSLIYPFCAEPNCSGFPAVLPAVDPRLCSLCPELFLGIPAAHTALFVSPQPKESLLHGSSHFVAGEYSVSVHQTLNKIVIGRLNTAFSSVASYLFSSTS